MGTSQYITLEQQISAFWNKVAVIANDDLCWIWNGATDSNGYGNKKWFGKYKKAHQIAWLIPDYVIPKGMMILHSCDNPLCCNPKHLRLGTHQENMDDMNLRNRRAVGDKVASKGENNPKHILTKEQVKYIRERYAKGDITQKQLALEIGISKSNIGYIVNGIYWKDIE